MAKEPGEDTSSGLTEQSESKRGPSKVRSHFLAPIAYFADRRHFLNALVLLGWLAFPAVAQTTPNLRLKHELDSLYEVDQRYRAMLFSARLYLSPFLCNIRNDAARHGFIYDYPVFGILYGRSNCGKSELIRLPLKSMFGLDGFLEKDWFTKSKVAGLREQNQRYPLAFDDLDAARFNAHAVALIKEDHLVGQYPAVVLSMNQEKDSFETEIRKRCLVLYTDASLPDHTGVSRTLTRQVKRLKAQLGTAFYRRYLLRVCEQLQTEGFPLDILTFSSEIMVALFRESLPPQTELPAWCTVVSLDGYTRGKHDKVRTELLEILQHTPTAWQVSGTRAVLLMEPMTLCKLRKDIPDYLLSNSRQGDRLVFKKDGLEAFLKVQMGKKTS